MSSEKRERKSLVFIGNFLSHHFGAVSVSETVAQKLTKRGWRVFCASSKVNKILRLVDMLQTVWAQRADASLVHIDVFSGTAFLWADLVSFFAKKLGLGLIFTLHGGGLVEFSMRYPARARRVLARADAVVTPSKFLQSALREFRSDIQYIPNGMKLSAYDFCLRNEPRATLIWLRAFHRIYHPELAVETLALLKEDFPDIRLLMVGPDKGDGSFESVQKLVIENGLAEQVQFVGAVPKADVPIWLQKGDVFLNTTRYESFGVGVMEAAACGLPIVTTNVGELPHLWQDGEDALLVAGENPQEMSAAIKRILDDRDLAAKLSQNARHKAEGFDWSVLLPQWEMIFRELNA